MRGNAPPAVLQALAQATTTFSPTATTIANPVPVSVTVRSFD